MGDPGNPEWEIVEPGLRIPEPWNSSVLMPIPRLLRGAVLLKSVGPLSGKEGWVTLIVHRQGVGGGSHFPLITYLLLFVCRAVS